ncbi:hypothetical protein OG705_29885 [Streptomyces sp. NBC_00838]|uniref:hypothetical protein n=1 Tax=Streptomyces sp. NBC_00838 TaxID=2903680 RepID=UPI0038636DF5|nr:hypothetical protein OG705_29885 [Streptomyces sp. NBC_00838]
MDDIKGCGIGTRDDRMRTCGKCGEDLVPQTQVDGFGRPTGGVFWIHLSEVGGGKAGHKPTVVVGAVRRWCDLCGPKSPAGWSYQVIPITTRRLVTRVSAPSADQFTDEPTGGGQFNDTPWYACEDCAELIERDQYSGLLKRTARVYAERTGLRMTTDMRVSLHETHQQFQAMKTGARVQIDWDR